MGGKLTVLENRTKENIEIRVWVDPDRPDQFRQIIRIKPGGRERVRAKALGCRPASNSDGILSEILMMVYANGGWTGKYILPLHLVEYAKVICGKNQRGEVILLGKMANSNICRLSLCAFFPGKYLGKNEEDLYVPHRL